MYLEYCFSNICKQQVLSECAPGFERQYIRTSKEKVEKSIEESSYEAGNIALFIPVSGNIFSKLWGQKMRETRKYYIIASDTNCEVDKDVFDDLIVDMDFYAHFAKHSEMVLNFSRED